MRAKRQRPSRPIGGMVLAALLLAGCERVAGTASGTPAPPRPNIIFILVDTLRADRLGAYGDRRGLTSWMDSLAREGVLFERVIAASPWTLPSVASYFSGYYPEVHKVTSYEEALGAVRNPQARVRLFGQAFVTLAEALQAGGYQTAGFSANPFVTARFGFAQGFEHFDDSFAANTTDGDVVNAAALAWLAQRDRSRPLFLYLHYMDVHDPYVANDRYVNPLLDAVEATPVRRTLTQQEVSRHRSMFYKSARPYRRSSRHKRLARYAEYWRARYDAGVAQIDEHLRALQAGLKQMGLWDEAYVVFTADHGESLGEHYLWAHGLSAHQDQLHVPFILRWPGRLPAGQRVAQTVRLFDLMPTLLEQLQIQPPAGIQARSLVGLLRGQSLPSLPALAEAVKKNPGQKALVWGEWKLLADTAAGHYQLYQLGEDPTEQRDLADRFPERVAELRRLLEQQIAENRTLGARFQVEQADVTEEELRRFKAIGYFGGDEAAEPNAPEQQPNQQEAQPVPP